MFKLCLLILGYIVSYNKKTSMFKKGKSGNPKGKPKGAKSEKIKQWEALGESIVGEQADHFNQFLKDLWSKPSSKQQAADLYLKTLSYFKPQLARTENKNKNDNVHTIKFNGDVRDLARLTARKPRGDSKEEEEI